MLTRDLNVNASNPMALGDLPAGMRTWCSIGKAPTLPHRSFVYRNDIRSALITPFPINLTVTDSQRLALAAADLVQSFEGRGTERPLSSPSCYRPKGSSQFDNRWLIHC